MGAVTMKDIARKAGVSRPTVSLVLNGRETQVRISEKTKSRVLNAAKRLGYRRNEIARSMVTGKTNFIGFVGDISVEYTSRILKGIAEEAEVHGYYVKIFSFSKRRNFKADFNSLLEQRPAGLIFRSLREEEFKYVSQECLSYGIPIAVVGSSHSHTCGISVGTNDEEGAAMAVRHLAELGHCRIAHISSQLESSGFAELRRNGFLRQMKELSLNVPDEYIVCSRDQNGQERLTTKLFSSKQRPTALFCASDQIAMIAIRAARKSGLRVPQDISVIGFANMNMSLFADPPLTTVAEPFDDMGKLVADELIREIESKKKISFKKPIEKILDVELVVRASTGPAPA